MVDKIWYNMEELIGGSEERVLIETYWNVNKIKDNVIPVIVGINRNILECKFKLRHGHVIGHICINRNILECKLAFTVAR